MLKQRMQSSLLCAALLHCAVFMLAAGLLTYSCVNGYLRPLQLQSTVQPSSVSLPVVTICPEEPVPAKLVPPPTCLYSLTQGVHAAPQQVSTRAVQRFIRALDGHSFGYSCHECNADRAAPLPATGISQLYLEVNRSGSAQSPFAPTLIAYTGGAVGVELPVDQLHWQRLYQQEAIIHQLSARKLERINGDVVPTFDVTTKSLPCNQATHGERCDHFSVLMVRYARLDVLLTQEAPSFDVLLTICALAGAASCLLVSLRSCARLLTGARGFPTEAETLHLLSTGGAPLQPPIFSDPYTGTTVRTAM